MALSRRGHDTEIVATNVDGDGVLDVPIGRAIHWKGALATFHPVSNPEWYGTSWSMAGDLRRRLSSFDVVHIHGLYRFHGLATAILARTQGIPYVIQAHGSLDPWHRAHRRRAKDFYHAVIEDRVIAGAAAMLCTSRREQSSIRRLGYSVPSQVIPIGVDAADLRAPVSGDTALDVDGRERVVAFLGRISAKKGVPLLLEAFRRTTAAFPSARLVIAGPDDEGIGRNLEGSIAGAGLEDRITFTGVLGGPEKRYLLQRADVLVLPSADESFGISVAEAMAVGCPVVVSPDVAIEDVVRSSGAGLVVDRDPSAIAEAVAHILREPMTAATMGAAGRRVVDEEFSWDVVGERMEALYGSVLRDRRSMRRRSEGVPMLPSRADGAPASLLCPDCRSRIEPRASATGLSCGACGWRGLEADGIAILLLRPELSDHDELDHEQGGHKAAQSAHFDRPGEEEFRN